MFFIWEHICTRRLQETVHRQETAHPCVNKEPLPDRYTLESSFSHALFVNFCVPYYMSLEREGKHYFWVIKKLGIELCVCWLPCMPQDVCFWILRHDLLGQVVVIVSSWFSVCAFSYGKQKWIPGKKEPREFLHLQTCVLAVCMLK